MGKKIYFRAITLEQENYYPKLDRKITIVYLTERGQPVYLKESDNCTCGFFGISLEVMVLMGILDLWRGSDLRRRVSTSGSVRHSVDIYLKMSL